MERRALAPLALTITLAAGCQTSRDASTSTGAATTQGGSSSGGSSSSGSTTGTTGTATGGFDAGCRHPGHVAELGACVLSADCQCPLECLLDPRGNLLCQPGCSGDADCDGGVCGDAGVCTRLPSCNLFAGAREFEGCAAVTDCQCPGECFADPRLGFACEIPCQGDQDCLVAGLFCETDAGACELATSGCNPGRIGGGELESCGSDSDCLCPLGCFADQWRGRVCELPCRASAACADAGGFCELDAGSCQPPCSADAGGALLSCANSTQCSCPLRCVYQPTTVSGFCQLCDGGQCTPPSGICADAGAEAAAAQSALPPHLGTASAVACTSNTDCACPNRCLPLRDGYSLGYFCQLAPACSVPADCHDPTASCLDGACLPNACAPTAQVGDRCDLQNGVDAPPIAGDGVCMPSRSGNPNLVCSLGGDGGAGCDLFPDRTRPAALCPAGAICVDGDAGTSCASVCSFDVPCDGGTLCALLNPGVDEACAECRPLSACLPAGASCTDDLPTYLPPGGPFDATSVGGEDAPCAANECRCPLSCTPDPALAQVSLGANAFCERPCLTAAECPAPMTTCTAGSCTFNGAGCLSGDAGLALGSACDAGSGPGTCVLFLPFTEQDRAGISVAPAPVEVCRSNGPAQSSCDPAAPRNSAELCGAGADCLPIADGGFSCQALCDPQLGAAACALGESCVRLTRNRGGPDEGACFVLGDGGCPLGAPDNELSLCAGPADCACGLGCFPTWHQAPAACARPCSLATDCPNDAVCFGQTGKRSCQLNVFCTGTTCDADVTGSGTCVDVAAAGLPAGAVPRAPPEAQPLYAVCFQAGTATELCDPAADRTRPDLVCVPGAYCDSSGAVPTCTSLCERTAFGASESAVPCSSGASCLPLPSFFAPSSGVDEGLALEGECVPARGVDAGP